MNYSDIKTQIIRNNDMKSIGRTLSGFAVTGFIGLIPGMLTFPSIKDNLFGYQSTFAIALFLGIHLMNKSDKKSDKLDSDNKILESNDNSIMQ